MTRQFIEIGFKRGKLDFDQKDLHGWLQSHALDGKKNYLLAHALDGVIWGEVSRKSIVTSGQLASDISPELRLDTLRQLRLFNSDYEIKLWHDGSKWNAIRIEDDLSATTGAINEPHLLWGTYGEQDEETGFTLLEDGNQGLKHILPPLPDKNKNDLLSGKLGTLERPYIKRATLCVRHYLQENEIGVNSIGLSRLVALDIWESKNNE